MSNTTEVKRLQLIKNISSAYGLKPETVNRLGLQQMIDIQQGKGSKLIQLLKGKEAQSETNTKLNQRNFALMVENGQLKAEVKRLSDENEGLKGEVNTLEARIDILNDQCAKYKAEIEEIKELSRQATSLREVEVLQAKVNIASKAYLQAQKEIVDLAERNKMLSIQLRIERA